MSTQSHIDPTAWSLADKDFRRRFQKKQFGHILSQTIQHYTQPWLFTRPQLGLLEGGSRPQQHHSANHRYLATKEIKRCREWRRISLWLEHVCFKCVTQSDWFSPFFSAPCFCSPLYLHRIYICCSLAPLQKESSWFYQNISLGMDQGTSPRATHDVHVHHSALPLGIVLLWSRALLPPQG